MRMKVSWLSMQGKTLDHAYCILALHLTFQSTLMFLSHSFMDGYIHRVREEGESECWFSGHWDTFQIKDKMPALLELMF